METTTRRNGNGRKRTCVVSARFTEAEHEELQKLLPEGEELAAFVRRMALKAARNSGDPLLKTVAAFVVGVLSPDFDPDQAAELLEQHLAQKEG